MKPYYADYSAHMLRYYCRRTRYAAENGLMPQPTEFASRVDQLNWAACDRVVKTLSREERDIVMVAFCAPVDEQPALVNRYAAEKGISNKYVWGVVWNTSLRVAKVRGLVPVSDPGSASQRRAVGQDIDRKPDATEQNGSAEQTADK